MQKFVVIAACFALAACSHVPGLTRQPVVGVVEYDTGITRFSTVTGIYHQDMCSKQSPDVQVHLSDGELRSILSMADKTGFYKVSDDLTTTWPDPTARPPHCTTFRLRIESGALHNQVRWDCGPDGSNAPPAQVAPMVESIQ
ncbi:MAG TPA: hypothetical protein VK753_08100, partial [Xanthomonadaceae bacterium]|nr:hypothetical protein [Xanthomonadaceae bacterium]